MNTSQAATAFNVCLCADDGTYNCCSQQNDQYKGFYESAAFITGLICYPIICTIGLTGNFVSIIVLCNRKMTNSTYIYLTALAVSDSIKLLNDSFYFLTILLLHTDPVKGNKAMGYLYPYAHYFFNVSVCITAWITVALAAERYIMVCHATRARWLCNLTNARLISTFIFFTMTLLTVPLALRYRTISVFNNQTNTTKLEIQVTELWQDTNFVTVYTWMQNLFRSIIPLAILCTLNYFIIQSLRRTRIHRRTSARYRVTLMLLSVIFVFMFCVTPDAIMSTFFRFGYYDEDYLIRGIREITDLLLTINSATNFILYCTFNKVFRKHFVSLFCKCIRFNKGHTNSDSRKSVAASARPSTYQEMKHDIIPNGHGHVLMP